jgi:hypothetical protein
MTEQPKTTDYQDILSTEDCILDALMKLEENNDTDNKDNNGTVSVPSYGRSSTTNDTSS